MKTELLKALWEIGDLVGIEVELLQSDEAATIIWERGELVCIEIKFLGAVR